MTRTNIFTTFILVALMALFLGCASTERQQGFGESIDDTVITTKVKAAILGDDTLKLREISVETFKGVVQLSGFVDSQTEINRAVELTRGVNGVRSVENSIQIK